MLDGPPLTGPTFHDPRMRGFRVRSTVEDAQHLIDARVGPLGAESVPLDHGYGRVLAESVVASVSVPPFDRAAMDGYAIRGEETFGADGSNPAPFRLVGRSRPGRAFYGMVMPGEAVEIATGAPVPQGADAVAKVESSRIDGSTIRIVEPTPPGRNVGRIGEDIRVGTMLFGAGRILRAQDLGVLSSLGAATLSVHARPSVAILITGDELLPPGTPPRDSCIADMNSVMLAALVARDGGIPRVFGPVPDLREQLRSKILELGAANDILLISGGTSTGPEDHAPSIVAELGELAIHGVALRPASPTGMGFVGQTPVVLLPGNPVSCLCAYDFFGGRIVRRLGGRPPKWPYRPIDLPLGEKLVSSLGRVDYVRVKIVEGRVHPLATSGASILSGTSRADGFVVVPSGCEGYPPLAVVRTWCYEG